MDPTSEKSTTTFSFFRKKFTTFSHAFLEHTFEQTVEKPHFFELEIFLSKISEIGLFLDRSGAHCRARRPLHDRYFQTPVFQNPFFERFLKVNDEKS